MSIRKRFNEAFGLEDSVEEERRRFVERVNQINLYMTGLMIRLIVGSK